MLSAQRLAAEAVHSVLGGRSLTASLEQLLSRHPELDPRVRAALWDIAHGTLRQLGLLRAVLARILRKPLTQSALEALLAVALYQLAFTREKPYAVVHQAVEAAGAGGRPWAKPLANAVLRRFQREQEHLLADARTLESARYSYPQWWIDRVRAAYPDAWTSILEAGNRLPGMALRVNALRCGRDDYIAALRAAGFDGTPVGDVGIMLARPVPVAQLPGFGEGWISVQDAGAQCAARYLDAADGMRVLDACAAPGGKAAHILERARVELHALDNDATRIGRIEQNLARLGLAAHVRLADAAALDTWWDGRAFDRVLLDAPCTASGVVRRHPDVKWLRRESDLARLAAQATRLLDALWRVLKPGGKLLFATCSVFPEENRARIDDFVGRHADARIAPLPGHDGLDEQLLPDDSHDGFYYALIERR